MAAGSFLKGKDMLTRSVLENVASALSDKYNIKIMFKGGECYTDGKLIVLPSLPEKVPSKLIELIRGYLDHEVAHIIFSDFDIFDKILKEEEKTKKPLKFITNAVEDVRIEREMAKVYRGCKLNLQMMNSYVTEKMKVKYDKEIAEKGSVEDVDPIFRVMLFFIHICHAGWDSPFVEEYAFDIRPLLEHLEPEIEATVDLKNTKDAMRLAQTILEKIETFTLPDPIELPEMGMVPDLTEGGDSIGTPIAVVSREHDAPESPSTTGSPDDSGKPEEKEAKEEKEEKASGKKSEEKEEKPKEKGTKASGDKPEKKPEKKPASAASGKDKPEAKPSGDAPDEEPIKDEAADLKLKKEKDELKEKIKKALSSGVERELPTAAGDIKTSSKSLKGYRVYSTERDTFSPHSKGGIENYQEITDEFSSMVNTLRSRMARILLSKKRSRWIGNRKKGLLNPSQLHQVISKTSESVYRMRIEGIKMNTAVSILVDQSGSMGSGKTEVAKRTTAILAETLNAIGITFEIMGFSGDRHLFSTSTRRSEWGRTGSLEIYYFKTFEESFGRPQKERISGMVAHSENYDGESVRFAANRLLARKEKKKILFVLSDGIPAARGADNTTLRKHLTTVVKELERIPDLSLFGFGINTDAPAKFYRNHILVKNIAKLPETLISALYKELM